MSKQTPAFLVGIQTLNGRQVGYIVNKNGSITLGRSLTTDQHRAAYEAIENLKRSPAMVTVHCDFGIRVDRVG